jgi:hypothetical protein
MLRELLGSADSTVDRDRCGKVFEMTHLRMAFTVADGNGTCRKRVDPRIFGGFGSQPT